MTKMQYYLYLESHVFLFVKGQNVLLYDSFGERFHSFTTGGGLDVLLKELLELRNMYAVVLTEEQINDPFVKDFIELIRIYFFGDLISRENCLKKPIQFPPILDFQKQKPNSGRNNGEEVLRNLKELTVFVTDYCQNTDCGRCCDQVSKQTLFCKREEDYSFLDIQELTDYLNNSYIRTLPIYLVGGDLRTYPYKNEIIALSRSYEKMIFCMHYTQLAEFAKENDDLNYCGFIDYPVKTDYLDKLLSIEDPWLLNAKFKFLVRDIDTFTIASAYQELYKDIHIEIVPIFDDNHEFFFENIYTELEDLLIMKPTKRDIFRNQVLNGNNFGKLIIDSNGFVRSGLIAPSLHHIASGSIKEAVLMSLEQNSDSAWFEIRNMQPCCSCVYQFICPPPSTYEAIIGKNNLCKIKE